MKIIILGAGEVGGTLAANLASEKNDITVVDADGEKLRQLQDKLDIAVVAGMASHPSVLRKAGADDADLLIAVTSSDEINMMACQVAWTLFRTPTKISRIRSLAYSNRDDLFGDDKMPVDVIISPEELVTGYIKMLLQYPGSLQVMDFADGRVQLVAVKATYGGKLVGRELQEIRRDMPKIDTRVAAVFRKGSAIQPTASTVVESGDEVFFIAAKEHIMPVMSEFSPMDESYRRIMIAGGGNIGERLCRAVESHYHVKVIERSYDRCRYLSENLRHTTVLNGSASNHDLLRREDIGTVDVFLALTNDDEANIMSSMLAKKLGAKKVITLITNPAYVDLVEGGEIDIALSPQNITIGSLLTHVRKGDISKVHSLRRGAAESLEVVAHGDARSSKVVGHRLDEIDLPDGVTIGAIVRNSEVLIAHSDRVVESEDHLIFFLVDKSKISKIEKLFQVGFHFF